jgi:hypothetical protein
MYSPPSVPPLCFAKRGNVIEHIHNRKTLNKYNIQINLSIKNLLPLYGVEREAGRVSTGKTAWSQEVKRSLELSYFFHQATVFALFQ